MANFETARAELAKAKTISETAETTLDKALARAQTDSTAPRMQAACQVHAATLRRLAERTKALTAHVHSLERDQQRETLTRTKASGEW